MLKALIKKELLQLNQFYIFNNKTKQLKTKKQIITTVALYSLLFIFVGASIGALDFSFAVTFIDLGLDWLYFSMTGLIAIVLGVFGDVFNTYSLLYKAKDNDLLLSMPIPPAKLLFSRILGVYLMGMLYESIAFVPAMIVYWILADVTILTVVCPIILWIVMGFFVAVLTCVLGWVVAVISSKLQNKSFTKLLATLAFLGVYYLFYFKAMNKLQEIAMYTDVLSETFSTKMLLSYQLGKAASGNLISLLIYTAVVGALFAFTYYVMTRSYIKLVTTNKGAKKIKYEKKESKQNSVSKALLKKEFGRFYASSTYMLNAGLSAIILVAIAIVILVKMSFLRELLPAVNAIAEDIPWIVNVLPVAVAVLPIFMLSMNYASAPSISLEGKEIWILQSLPVDAKQVLHAKMKMHMVLYSLPTVFFAVVLSFALQLSLINAILAVLCNLLYVVYTDMFGLWVDSKKYNLNWTNEVYPIKQGFSVTVVLLSGWAFAVILAGLYFLVRNLVGATVFIVFEAVLLATLSLLFYRNLTTKFAKKFAFIN